MRMICMVFLMNNDESWHAPKTYEGLISLGTLAIRFALVSNGGAIISLLTFLGHNSYQARDMAISFIILIVGVFTAGLLIASAYITQLALYNEDHLQKPLRISHKSLLRFSVSLFSLSIFCFGLGSGLAAWNLCN